MFPGNKAHEPLELLGVDWSHWPPQPGPSLMCRVLITPTDARCSLDVHTCVLSIHHRSLGQHTFPMHPVPVAPTLPAETRTPAGSAGREREWADLRHQHLAAPPAAAAGSPRDRVQQVPARARPGWERASGRGIRPPTASRREPGRRQNRENSGSMTDSRGEGGRGERRESAWL